MNITEAKYYKGVSDNALLVKATIDGEETHVPAVEGNRHWEALQEWVAKGNTIAEAD